MSGVYGLTSISGSPGVTTAAIAWAYLSDHPTLVIEADPTGGSPILAGVFKGAEAHTRSILSLTVRPPGIGLVDHIWSQTLGLPGTGEGTERPDRYVLPGIASSTQGSAIQHLWGQIGRASHRIAEDGGYDVVIDLGRARFPLPTNGLLPHLDAVGVLAWESLPGLHPVVAGLEQLREALGEVSGSSSTTTRTGLIGVQPVTGRYTVNEIGKVIPTTPTLGQLPWAPEAASTYHQGAPAPRRAKRARYEKRIRQMIEAITGQADTYATTMKGDVA